MSRRSDNTVTAGDLWQWLRQYRYEVVVAQTADGRRVAWVAQPPDRPPLPDDLRRLVVRCRYDLAAIADEHDHLRCKTARLNTILWSRGVLRGLEAWR